MLIHWLEPPSWNRAIPTYIWATLPRAHYSPCTLPIFAGRFEELCVFLAPVLLTVRALEDCQGIEWANLWNSFPRVSDRLFLNISRKERSFKNQLALSLGSLPIISLPKEQVLRMHTALQISQQKLKSTRRLYILDLCVCERYNSADSSSGTYTYRLLKGIWFLMLCLSLHMRNKQQS